MDNKKDQKCHILIGVFNSEEDAETRRSELYVIGFRNVKIVEFHNKYEVQIHPGTRKDDLYYLLDELSIYGYSPIVTYGL